MLDGRLALQLLLGGVIVLAAALCASAQQPLPPASPQESAPPPQLQPGKKPPKHSQDLRILGTVFTPEGFSLPGAEVHIRRVGEKKFHGADVTNSLGEFALWVPLGAQYELIVRARGCEEQSRRIDGNRGESFLRLTIRMQLTPGGKRK